MNYHIVSEKTPSKKHDRTHHDWHFQATLFGAVVFFMLMVPLMNVVNPVNQSNVLGANTQVAEKRYDSQYGYYETVRSQTVDNRDIFTRFVDALLTIFE